MHQKHVLLIDGMALLFRSFFATAISNQFMVNRHGNPTNAIQGFLRHSLTAIEQVKPTHVAVCWDMGQKTFRNEVYTEYKANRQEAPLELIPQFDLVKEIATHFSFANIGVKGYEADDCIGTIAKVANSETKVSIVSGDKDLLQLLTDHVEIWLVKKGYGEYDRFTHSRFQEEYGITPAQFIDVKGLMGDTSDGYPGVKGIGEKTAFKLIREHESIEGILENLHLLTPGQKKKIEADLDMLHLSRKLAAIHCEVPLPELYYNEWSGVPSAAGEIVDHHELKTVHRFLASYQAFTGERI
ncbi:5'-3' exonuclease [Jeotgalibacillus proteolyticus]|uniref:5'-3' exonuclease n=1 Tax=Jeotgalibacillus proteolyticus TaxID=2082395 RepID=A0A2S5GDU7_9BACL|nr:5'-3' exonuclease [Jeotgalibacillus proteolyticus]PPA71217.1 flap endonuclease [Jeotgalibacillus proteolyticus]